MKRNCWTPALRAGAWGAIAGIAWLVTASPVAAQTERVSFSKDVLPIFQARCATCHGIRNSGGLRLDSFDNVMLGGGKGKAVTPRSAANSLLIQRVEGSVRPRMPQGQPRLPQDQILTIRRWITQGARDDSSGSLEPLRAEQPLTIQEPKDGQQVTEKVRISIPREGVPPEGFVAIYINDRFIVAKAIPEELPSSLTDPEGTMPVKPKPVVHVWDTKLPLSTDRTLSLADRMPQDGPHVIEVRSYDSSGAEVERLRVQVELQNQVVFESTLPLRLIYRGRVGESWKLKHEVDFQANAGESAGARRRLGGVRPSGLTGAGGYPGAPGGFSGAAPGGASGLAGYPGAPGGSMMAGAGGLGGTSGAAADKNEFSSKENSLFLISLEDMTEGLNVGFWRERRESPLQLVIDNRKQIIRFRSPSQYYTMRPNGKVRRSKVMERVNREPIINPIELPGRPHRANETFLTTVRVNLGAYIPGALIIPQVEASIMGMEMEGGQECAKIVCAYNDGSARLTIYSANLRDVEFTIERGLTTVWFAHKIGRVMKVEHDIQGTLTVPIASTGGGQGGFPGAGGDAMMGGYPGGGAMGGYPGGAGGYPGGAGAYPGGAGGYPGYPGAPGGVGAYPGLGGAGGPMIPGGAGGYPGYPGAPGAAGSSYPGAAGSGYPGAMGGGYPGAMGGYPGAGGGGGTGIAGLGPQTKNFHVTLRVKTRVDDGKGDDDLLR